MSPDGSTQRRLRPVRSRAVRRAIFAPELERYLARRNVDLMVTDQLEALQVRVRRGIEVLEGKRKEGRKAARRETLLLALGTAGCLAGAWLFGSWFAVFAMNALGLASLALLVRCAMDDAQLSRLEGRYAWGVERAKTVEELLDFAESALEDAGRLGMIAM